MTTWPDPVSNTTRKSWAGDPTFSTPEYEVLKDATLPCRLTGDVSRVSFTKVGPDSDLDEGTTMDAVKEALKAQRTVSFAIMRIDRFGSIG
jgi:hypothetical protein